MSPTLFDAHRRVAIDSNVLIYLLDGSGELADRAAQLVDSIADGRTEGVLSALVLAEVCSGPARLADAAMVERYADELCSLEGVRVVAVDADVGVEAAIIKGSTALSIADAIHLACARRAGASVFVTNDRRIGAINRLEIAYLDELDLQAQP